jgi:hypothetical protein
MKRFAAFFAFCGLFALALGVEAAPLLPMVVVEIDGKPAAPWWTKDGLQLTEVEQNLVNGLLERGRDAMDPAALEDPPRVSRIYRTRKLSRSSSVNLGGLYGAGLVLAGKVSAKTSAGPAGLRGAECAASVELLTVPGGESILEISMARHAWDEDERAAITRAMGFVTRDLTAMVAEALTSLEPPVGLVRDEPYVQVVGVWDRDALSRVQAALLAHPEVDSARLAWATEGRFAFDLNPKEDEGVAQIQSIAKAVVGKNTDGVLLSLPARGAGRVVLRADRPPEDGLE